ncbi:MAG: Holliday junction branch migration DNA helicase RuvB [Candidatus Hydrogenedentota bacterium]
MVDRFIKPTQVEEADIENSLRPKTIEEFIGQEEIKSNLRVFIDATKKRNEPLDHVLIYGPPGLGKTTLAYIIASELNATIKGTSGPAIEKKGELTGLLTDLEDKSVFFIDEIHRLNPMIEEILYPAMEDFEFDIVIGKGPGARSVKITVSPFTLVGATTRAGMLTSPLRERFGIVFKLQFYNYEEIKKIIFRSANILGVKIDEKGADIIARRSRGTPRVANRLLRRTKDFAEILGDGSITEKIAIEAMRRLDIDEEGLTSEIREYLKTIIEKYSTGPVGLKTLAISIGESEDTIEDIYEPILIQKGFIKRTPSGRKATEIACKFLGYNITKDQTDIF